LGPPGKRIGRKGRERREGKEEEIGKGGDERERGEGKGMERE